MNGERNKEIYTQNSSTKNSARENTYMLLTVRGNNTSKIIENRWYQMKDIAIKKYYGTKLSTNSISIFKEIEK